MALRRICIAATRPHSLVSASRLLRSHESLLSTWIGRGSLARSVRGCRRTIYVAPVLMPPVIFAGLFVALWCWKCMMLVLFQNYIVYNPFLPPNARSMRIEEYARECGGIRWREERIRSLDGTEIAMCVSDVPPASNVSADRPTPVYILYFQGNASSLPPRLPDLSLILRRVRDDEAPATYTMVCLSYRGYWTSHDRPSERGINMDSQAAMQWISQLHKTRSADLDVKPVVIFWGQSIGCGFATNLASQDTQPSNLQPDALLLETPFTSTREMLRVLYPQKWLPYQYLWPFLRSQLDSWKNLGVIAQKFKEKPPGIHIVEAGKDELVPAQHGEDLYQRCKEVGLPVERYKVHRALHNEAMVKAAGKQVIAQSISLAVAQAQARAQTAAASSPGQKRTGQGNA